MLQSLFFMAIFSTSFVQEILTRDFRPELLNDEEHTRSQETETNDRTFESLIKKIINLPEKQSQDGELSKSKRDMGCTDCKKSRQQILDERELRLEIFKGQILDKLRMKEAPKFPNPKMVIPAPLLSSVSVHSDDEPQKQEKDDYYGKTTQVIVFSDKVVSPAASSHIRQKARITFRLTEKTFLQEKVDTVNLYFYKLSNPMSSQRENTLQLIAFTSLIYEGEKRVGKRGKKIISSSKTKSNEDGWVVFEVTDILKHWVKKATKTFLAANHTSLNCFVEFEVKCLDCGSSMPFLQNNGSDRPFLVVYPKRASSARNRRAIDCDAETTTCCRQEFQVSVKELNWDNWIIQPPSFTPNYCAGSCHGRHLLPKHYHTTVLQKFTVLSKKKTIQLCCSPTKMSSLSLMYYNSEGYIIKRDLPNMQVQECGCS